MSDRQLAPIALFVYNRLDHLKQTVAALKQNHLASESDLIVYSDGAKNENAKAGVKAVREYLKTINGFRSVSIIERERNFGLARSIISGVTEVIERQGKIIVLEDDLVTSPYFLEFMNQGLNMYQADHIVNSIHGYLYPFSGSRPESFFLKEIDCWGWATWADRWKLFRADGQALLKELKSKGLIKEFDLEYSYHFSLMLREQVLGLNNSWAIRWYASSFLRDSLGLYPKYSLVRNIGCDASGVHTGSLAVFDTEIYQEAINLERQKIIEDVNAKKNLVRFFRSPNRLLIFQLMRLKNELRLRIFVFKAKICQMLGKKK